MKEKKPKKKRDFMGVYKRFYDPAKEGFGSPEQWQEAFARRMGLDEAKKVLKDRSPYAVLGISESVRWEEVKSAYRKKAMQYHPDRNPGDEEALAKFKEVQAAYEILEAHVSS